MVVYALSCSQSHQFEGWFRSPDDFVAQSERFLVSCPTCGDVAVSKLPSAPYVHTAAQPAPKDASPAESANAVFADPRFVRRMMREFILQHTLDVGSEFPAAVRRIHAGEEPHRNLRGVASREEAEALVDEGIQIAVIAPEVISDEGH